MESGRGADFTQRMKAQNIAGKALLSVYIRLFVIASVALRLAISRI